MNWFRILDLVADHLDKWLNDFKRLLQISRDFQEVKWNGRVRLKIFGMSEFRFMEEKKTEWPSHDGGVCWRPRLGVRNYRSHANCADSHDCQGALGSGAIGTKLLGHPTTTHRRATLGIAAVTSCFLPFARRPQGVAPRRGALGCR